MGTVLVITDKPTSAGGIGRVVGQHREMLVARGWQVRELQLVQKKAETQAITAPIEVSLNLPDNAASLRTLRTAASGADVIHLHLGFSALSPAFVGAAADLGPLVVNLHDVSPFEGLRLPEMGVDGRSGALSLTTRLNRWRLAPVRREVWRRICADAKVIIAPSHYLARLAQAAGAPQERIVVLPHALADVTPEDATPPSACGPVIVYVGLLSVEKGASLLLEAFSRLTIPQAELVFVGDGPERAAMEFRSRNQRVRFLGQVGPGAVAKAMSQACVLAHPSLVPEGFGLVGIEAMQLGRPVVGFGLGGSVDWLIAGKTGLVANSQDAAALARVLDEVLKDAALADRLGAAAKVHVMQEFSVAKVAAGLSTILRSSMRAPIGQA